MKAKYDFIPSYLRKVTIIGVGRMENGIKAENIQKSASVKAFMSHGTELLRSDLALIYVNNSNPNFPVAVAAAVHEAGYVIIKAKNKIFEKGILNAGFYRIKNHVYKKKEKSTPKDYGYSYLKRFSNTDFLHNWDLAGRQILQHLPAWKNIRTVKILDVGCLNCFTMEILRLHGVRNIFGIDLSYYLAVKNCINPYHLGAITIGDFCRNSYPDKYFDMTIAFEVIEHIEPEKTELFLKEMKRITRDDGIMLISSSEDPDVDPTHINCRNRNQWYEEFLNSGLVPSGKQAIYPGFNSFVLKKIQSEKLCLKIYRLLLTRIYQTGKWKFFSELRKYLYLLQILFRLIQGFYSAAIHPENYVQKISYPDKKRKELFNSEYHRILEGQRSVQFNHADKFLKKNLSGVFDLVFWDLPLLSLDTVLDNSSRLLKKGGSVVLNLKSSTTDVTNWTILFEKKGFSLSVLEKYWGICGKAAGLLWSVRDSIFRILPQTITGKIFSQIIHVAIFALPVSFLIEMENLISIEGTESMFFVKGKKL